MVHIIHAYNWLESIWQNFCWNTDEPQSNYRFEVWAGEREKLLGHEKTGECFYSFNFQIPLNLNWVFSPGPGLFFLSAA